MTRVRTKGCWVLLAVFVLFSGTPSLFGQSTSDLQFRAIAVNFPRDEKVKVKLRGTTRYSQVKGDVEVEHKSGYTDIELNIKDLDAPSEKQYTTYVIWAVTPEGLADNLGEFRPHKTRLLWKIPYPPGPWGGSMHTATRFRTFSVVITAEPHFLVQSPSRQVVATNLAPEGKHNSLQVEDVAIDFRGDIGLESVPWREDRIASDVPLPNELLQARRALDIARFHQLEKYAEAELKVAEETLGQAEQAYERNQPEAAALLARKAIHQAERARVLNQERLDAQLKRQQELELADVYHRLELAEKETAAAGDEVKRTRTEVEEKERQLRQVKAVYDDEINRYERRQLQLEEELDRQQTSYIPVAAHQFMMSLAKVADYYYEGSAFVLALPSDDLFYTAVDDRAAILSQTGKEKLDRIARAMLSYPDVVCRIQTRIDGSDGATVLLRQAEMYATTVAAYLMTKGVPGERLQSVGARRLGASDRTVASQGRVDLVFIRQAETTGSTTSTASGTIQTP